jgi:hypothetical protein
MANQRKKRKRKTTTAPGQLAQFTTNSQTLEPVLAMINDLIKDEINNLLAKTKAGPGKVKHAPKKKR